MFFSLIFRTCFQKLSFKFLHEDIQKTSVNSVDSLFIHGYTIFVENGDYFQMLSGMQSFYNSQNYTGQVINVDPRTTYSPLCRYTEKTAYLVNSIQKDTPCASYWNILPEIFDKREISITFPESLVNLANKIILGMKNSGTLRALDENSIPAPVYHGPRVLTLRDLVIYFKFWMFMIVVCLLAFLIELIFGLVQECKKVKKEKSDEESTKVEKISITEGEVLNGIEKSLEIEKLEESEHLRVMEHLKDASSHNAEIHSENVEEEPKFLKHKEKSERKCFSPDDPEIPQKALRQYLEEMNKSKKFE